MAKVPPEERIKNFNEVALGYTPDEAIQEAKRCLQCKKPTCISGCPVEINIPKFIKEIAAGEFQTAIKTIKEKNNLPAICGRVCPQETQCEIKCILSKKEEPVAIGALERFVADCEIKQNVAQNLSLDNFNSTGLSYKVAVVGSGPAGLTCAADLARTGIKVTIFEALHEPGGVLRYGIPSFRLPRYILDYEVNYVRSLGVEIICNAVIGKTYTIQDLFEMGFKAIFICSGAGLPTFMNIPGENLCKVYSANEFLTRINLMKAHKFPEYDTPINIGSRVAVIGGGNTAMDAARCALRLKDADVTIIYRRSEQEMPARAAEIGHAKEEGIKFMFLTQPKRFIGTNDGFVSGIECLRCELGMPDSSGRPRPVPIQGSEFVIPADTVILAIGLQPNPLIPRYTSGLKTDNEGNIIVNRETMETTIKDIFAGGDIVGGEGTVIEAMGMAKRAAKAIIKRLGIITEGIP